MEEKGHRSSSGLWSDTAVAPLPACDITAETPRGRCSRKYQKAWAELRGSSCLGHWEVLHSPVAEVTGHSSRGAAPWGEAEETESPGLADPSRPAALAAPFHR